ncbi:hypothetical protein [Vannielia sp. SX4]|uniref:hypothetical protein n=1 Tax=Vannielia sp. SX4 TaxID=3463852 RepID=UPI0040598754
MSKDVEYQNNKHDLHFLPDGRVVNETHQDPAIPRVEGYQRFWIAADLGQANDYTAVIAIKDECLPIIEDSKVILGPRERTVVYADRFRDVSYVDVCDHLIRLTNAPPFGGKSELVIDGTSLGRVVSDMLFEQSVPHRAVQMTGGQSWSEEGARYVNAGKTFMIENTSVLFASGSLKFAHDLSLRKEIEGDLASFSLQTTAAGNQIITQARTTAGHGDLGISLIVGAFASQNLPGQTMRVYHLQGWT